MAVVFLLCMASPALADSCSAVGTFVFNVAGGYGTLVLSADGNATMNLTPGHGSFCETCLAPSRALNGTFRTSSGDGPCGFLLELSEPSARAVRINGAVAFQGRVLMFGPATDPENFGTGLALRSDTLIGQ